MDPKVQKNDCTIKWDEQVPLAGIIATQLEFEDMEKRKKNGLKLNDPVPEEIDLTEDYTENGQHDLINEQVI